VVSLPLGSKLLGEGDIRDYRASMMAEVVHKVNKAGSPDSKTVKEAAVRASQSTENAAAKAGEEDAVGLAQQLCLETYRFRESDLDMVGASSSQLPPFAIVASKVSLRHAGWCVDVVVTGVWSCGRTAVSTQCSFGLCKRRYKASMP
jgi:hypothetical protein